jgi:hypothetical protein
MLLRRTKRVTLFLQGVLPLLPVYQITNKCRMCVALLAFLFSLGV